MMRPQSLFVAMIDAIVRDFERQLIVEFVLPLYGFGSPRTSPSISIDRRSSAEKSK